MEHTVGKDSAILEVGQVHQLTYLLPLLTYNAGELLLFSFLNVVISKMLQRPLLLGLNLFHHLLLLRPQPFLVPTNSNALLLFLLNELMQSKEEFFVIPAESLKHFSIAVHFYKHCFHFGCLLSQVDCQIKLKKFIDCFFEFFSSFLFSFI